MLQVLRDPEALKLTGAVHDDAEPASLPEQNRFRDWYASRNDQPDRLDPAVIDRARGACVGEAVLNEWEPGNHSCSFRIALGSAGRGRRLGTEATRLIVAYGFERLGMHRISLEVYSFNPRARRVYEKAGFRAGGVLRESLRYGGQWIDATVMSILASAWAEHHGHPSQGMRLRPGGAGPLRRDVQASCQRWRHACQLTEGPYGSHFVGTDSTRDGMHNQSICAPRKGPHDQAGRAKEPAIGIRGLAARAHAR
jgi:RimJ/RimL family protein N-acetyltransferase